jgi:hypothetical protein
VTFLNDAYGGSAAADRNLYLDKVTIATDTAKGSTLTTFNTGPVTFGVSTNASGHLLSASIA